MGRNTNTRIKAMLTEGLTVRAVAGALGVSTITVQAVRAQYPNEFKRRGSVKKQPAARRVRVPSVAVFGRVPANIYAKFTAELLKRGLSRSGLLRFILSERYQDVDRFNSHALTGDCSCPIGSIVKNHNSNLDGDRFICERCGRVSEVLR